MHWILAVLVGLWLPWAAQGQVVPEGAAPAEVLHLLGQPRVRTTGATREIWTYPTFNVVFEQGRVRALTQTADAAGELNSGRSAPLLATREGGRSVLRSPERLAPAAQPRRLGVTVLTSLGVGCVIVAALGGAWWWRRRQAARGKVGATGARTLPPNPTRAPAVPPDRLAEFPGTKPPSLAEWELPLDLLRAVEWKRLERLVTAYFDASGWRVQPVGAGVEGENLLMLSRPGAQRAVHCVQYLWAGAETTGDREVREVFDRMARWGMAEATLIATGNFSSEAERFAGRNRITLLGGVAFVRAFNRLAPMVRSRVLQEVVAGDCSTPRCPRCATILVRQTGGDGDGVWRCPTYPTCRYSRRVPAGAGADAPLAR